MGIFGSKKKEEEQERAVVVSKTDTKQITTLIGESCVFEGNVTTTSSTRIDGQLKGKIAGEYSLVVGENGVVEGEIKAAETVVYGRVDGVIESGNLEVKSSGTVNGDVFIESLTVEKGATFNGRCEMSQSHENVVFEANGPGAKELSSGTIDLEETS